MQCFSRGWARLGFGVAIVALLAAPRAFGNAGTLLPLDQYQAGTDVEFTLLREGTARKVRIGIVHALARHPVADL